MGDIHLGTRPLDLVQALDEGELKRRLLRCAGGPFQKSAFSIGHRGAALRYPEHTRESYAAAARQGAGRIEADVTFTRDRRLVCRHSPCDLHRTTDILSIPALAAKCSQPFTPAVLDPVSGAILTPARARCCTTDITLAEFQRLRGRMDLINPAATTVEDYLAPVPDAELHWGTLMTHAESIELFQQLDVQMIPELKAPGVAMPYQGDYTRQRYAQQLIDDYKAAGVAPEQVFLQSFDLEDIRYWLRHEPAFGRQAVVLDGRYERPGFDSADPASWSPSMEELAGLGLRIIAPPIWMLLALDDGRIVPSAYARAAHAVGLAIIAWTLERSGPLNAGSGWYYQTVTQAIHKDSDMLVVLDVLAREVGVSGVFSDWPATVTYYANCMGL